jgi:hypothetical protein
LLAEPVAALPAASRPRHPLPRGGSKRHGSFSRASEEVGHLRQIMLDDSDLHDPHSKVAAGGVATAAIDDSAVFVFVDAMHRCPQGGSPVTAILDTGE